MLPKKYRLTKDKDFERITKKGKRFFSQNLTIKILKNNLDVSHFGIIVSLKIDKKATVRNKIKRRLRNIIFQELNNFKKGYDVMILTKPSVVLLNYQKMKEESERLFRRAKLIKVKN